jgi:hypothetical protein
VATALLLLPQVPLLFGVTLAVSPTHTLVAPPRTGLAGMALITTFVDEGDTHPFEFLTVKVNVVAGVNPVTVYVVPVFILVVPPGLRVRVQVPEAGNPLKATLPVGVVQVGWVITPTTGAVGLAFTVKDIVLKHPSEVRV